MKNAKCKIGWRVAQTLAILALVQSVALAAGTREILAKLPARSVEEGQASISELAKLGAAGVKEVCGQLVEPGQGDDSKARFALHGLALYVTRPGADSERLMAEGTILEALAAAQNPEVKAFLMEQLKYVAKDAAVAPLSGFLADERLCEPATQALLAIGTPKASAALAKALPGAKGKNLVTILRALGELRAKSNCQAILPLASSEDAVVRQTAWFALANAGQAAAVEVLAKAADSTGAYERSAGTASYLLLASRLAEGGDKDACAKICRGLMAARTAPRDSNVFSGALATLANALGAAALPDVLSAVDHKDLKIREAALQMLAGMEGPEATAQLVAKLKAGSPESRAAIVRVLGQRGDRIALPALKEALKDDNRTVRLAAIPALATLGGNEEMATLIAIMENGQADELKALKEALMTMKGEGFTAAVGAAVPKATPAAKALLFEILGARGATDQAAVIFAAAEDKDNSVRLAALRTLVLVASGDHAPKLLEMLLASADAGQRVELSKAVVAACRKGGGAAPVLAALANAKGDSRTELLRVLARLGGEQAVQAVLAEAKSDNAGARETAIRALSEWCDATPAPGLLALAREAKEQTQHVLALRGYLHLVALPNTRPQQQSIAMLNDALSAAQTDDEKKLVEGALSSLAKNKQPGVKGEAGEPKAQGQPGAHNYDQGPHNVAPEGFVLLFNGKDLTGWKGLVGDPISRAKMTPEALAAAEKKATEEALKHWKVQDGTIVYDGKNNSLCTEKKYGDFEMYVDWKIEPGGDSGIYIRGSPQVQIWDVKEGSGGLYNNQKNPSHPLKHADYPPGQWNRFRIKMIGEKVWVWLNEELVVDNVTMENYWDRKQPIFPEEQIELQHHGSTLWFRNIYIKEIPREK